MKKIKYLLIGILCNALILCNAQIAQDKLYHAGAGILISQSTFSFVNYKTNDYKLAFRVSICSNLIAAYGKEIYDSYQMKPFSWSDYGYTFLSGLVVSTINRSIQKRKQKKNKIEYKEFEFNPPLVKSGAEKIEQHERSK